MRRIFWLLPVMLFSGCAERATRPDADIFGNALKNMARAIAAGRAVDDALLAERRDDAVAFNGAVERLRRSGAPDTPALASSLTVVVAEDAVATAIFFDTMAEQQTGTKRELWQQRAADYYRRALKIAPDFPSRDRDQLNAVGYFLADRGQNMQDFRLAEDLTRRSLQRWDQLIGSVGKNDPRLPLLRFMRALGAHDSYAWALYKQGKFEEALREQSAALATAKATASSMPLGAGDSLAELFYHLGKIHAALGNTEEAQAAFEETLKIKPAHEEAQRGLKEITKNGTAGATTEA